MDTNLIHSDSAPVRVLHVFKRMGRGGAETWIMNVFRNIDRELVQFDFIVESEEPGVYDDEINELGGRVFCCGSTKRLISYIRRFRHVVEGSGPYDVIHCHEHHFSGIVLALGRYFSIPVRIAHSHNDITAVRTSEKPLRGIYYRITEHLVRRFATTGLAASHSAAVSLFGDNWKRDARFSVMFCGIDLNPLIKTTETSLLRSELGIDVDSLVIGHVGRFAPQKNHEFLLDVFACVIDLVPNSRLILVGDGPLRTEMESKAALVQVSDRTIFLGDRPDVFSLLEMVNVFAFPSLYEGLGLALIEAQAAGLPCVISDVVPTEADVLPELICRVPLSSSPDLWAQTIVGIVDRRVGKEKSLAVVEASDFSIHASVRQLVSIYGRESVGTSGAALRNSPK